jgi:glycosyltransferase involved in cell wall biosynthesis
MNVIFTIRYFHPFVGGTEKQALTLASHLAAKGVDVTILTSRFQRNWHCLEFMGNVKVVRLCSPRIKVIGALIFLSCLAGYLIRQRKNYSIIHTFQIGYTSFMSILLGVLLKKPTLLKLASSGIGGDISRARRTAWGRLCLLMATKASRIIAVSTMVGQELLDEQVSPAIIAAIANGVDVHRYDRHMDKRAMRKRINLPENNTVIFTGRLSSEKGVDYLIRGFVQLKKAQPCQLLIIADGPERENIVRLIKKCNTGDSVLLVSGAEEVAPYLAASDVFVLPSRFEGLSNALLEAMSCWLPVISTRVGGSKDVIQDGVNGLLVDVDQEEELADAMGRVLGDRQLAESLGRNARETVKAKHDISKIADAYIALYMNLQAVERVKATNGIS